MAETSDIIFWCIVTFVFTAMLIIFITIQSGNTEVGTLHRINTDLKYCPHPDYYYNDHMTDCDHFGITPTHPTLNLTGY